MINRMHFRNEEVHVKCVSKRHLFVRVQLVYNLNKPKLFVQVLRGRAQAVHVRKRRFVKVMNENAVTRSLKLGPLLTCSLNFKFPSMSTYTWYARFDLQFSFVKSHSEWAHSAGICICGYALLSFMWTTGQSLWSVDAMRMLTCWQAIITVFHWSLRTSCLSKNSCNRHDWRLIRILQSKPQNFDTCNLEPVHVILVQKRMKAGHVAQNHANPGQTHPVRLCTREVLYKHGS